MGPIISSPLACPALSKFSTLCHKRYDFREKNFTEEKMYVLTFSTTFVWNISSSKNEAKYDQKYILVFM